MTSDSRIINQAAPTGEGTIFILSAPSGAGKTTLSKALRQRMPHLAYSISYTTRRPRADEQEGQDYFFVSRNEFEAGIDRGRWAEWAQVHDNYYGTSAEWITASLQGGIDILMDIDVQGARQIVCRFPQAVTIFILPPSMEELSRRLRQRGTDSDDQIRLRMANASREIAQKNFYQYQIVNDDLDMALDRITAIITQHGRISKPSKN